MKIEDKELLLKDLCARLPYSVKCKDTNINITGILSQIGLHYDMCVLDKDNGDSESCYIPSCKPYLFPLLSMTEEQYNSLHELGILNNCSHSYEYVNPHIHGVSFIFKEFKTYSLELIEWLNKNHFDYRGLISMDLAIDATGLNIY